MSSSHTPKAQNIISRHFTGPESASESLQELENSLRQGLSIWEDISKELGIKARDIRALEYHKIKAAREAVNTLISLQQGRYTLALCSENPTHSKPDMGVD